MKLFNYQKKIMFLEGFNRWIRENNYVILDMFRRYETNQKFLISWRQ